jgi:DNA polymerase-1
VKLLAIDGNNIVYRSYYGVKLNTSNNNAILGFFKTLKKHMDTLNPDCIVVAFDKGKATFRHKEVLSYKANRGERPADLYKQFEGIKEILTAMDIKYLECDEFEADDILGTLATTCDETNNTCFIVSGDRDNLQLLSPNVSVVLATNKGDVVYTPDSFKAEYGFVPENLVDLKALSGDTSDNIKGVSGIGDKTATSLIQKYSTVENIYANVKYLSQSVSKKLQDDEESAKQSKWLATISREVPINKDLTIYKVGSINPKVVDGLFLNLGINSMIGKFGVRNKSLF